MPESKAQFQHPHAVLWTICIIALLSVAGVSLPYPVLAPLFAATELNAFNHWLGLDPTLLLGIALAANPAGILLGSAVLGALSRSIWAQASACFRFSGGGDWLFTLCVSHCISAIPLVCAGSVFNWPL